MCSPSGVRSSPSRSSPSLFKNGQRRSGGEEEKDDNEKQKEEEKTQRTRGTRGGLRGEENKGFRKRRILGTGTPPKYAFVSRPHMHTRSPYSVCCLVSGHHPKTFGETAQNFTI
eukprot:689537-Rhodomonas_salina.1